ncbi:FAD-dependent oxidoreductase [Desulfurispirillum indicum]|uniref:FAD-dependent pyridine nucleotide-disulfide oxidoreductase n=1 Tax=Desulfurispirillum indicum (strain ATCC BAA-1389 / DSM 22839 / S5) TaxID=653733 RepID=E6W0F0_DESIS|nr:FAD-dependent oxidoreductase [Desulfurispirillum indicum]ADU66368.1 FAD-dependent pyridine nucleotide-disulfide oxidoreductase [Desulfurispirillum indicum S5]UCZ55701.1 FAD-dependent oxidoreductase [Desulfurispirillum indicum]
MSGEKVYDVIIAGLGPAGESAAIYTARKNLSTLIVAYDSGGQLTKTFDVENYLGIPYSTGWEMAMKFEEHVRKYSNVEIELMQEVVAIEDHGTTKKFITAEGREFQGRSAIIATGAKPKTVGVKNEEKFNGKGLTYCTTCDGPLYRNKIVTIIGGGTSGVEAALEMVKIASKVQLIVRSQLRAEPILMDRLKEVSVDIYENTIPVEILGDEYVTGLRIRDRNSSVEQELTTDGIFVEIGRAPNADGLKNLLQTNDNGEIVISTYNETNIPGVFAAGDVTDVKFKQVIIAAGEGAKAAMKVSEYLIKQGQK